MDLKNVFQADPVSIERVLSQPGRGFYIPSYQRPYSWDKDAVKALVSSVAEGILGLETMDDGITFIGTLIFIHDSEYLTVAPAHRPDLPQSVFLVIDGQQRLTTTTLLAVRLHDKIRIESEKSLRLDGNGVEVWVRSQQSELLQRLERVFAHDNWQGEGHFQFYPRIVRAHRDSWRRTEQDASYTSPVAAMLASYIEHIKAGDEKSLSKPWKYLPDLQSDPGHKIMKANVRQAAKIIDDIATGRFGESDSGDDIMSSSSYLAQQRGIQTRLFNSALPDSVLNLLRKSPANSGEVSLHAFVKLNLFCRYLLDRVAVTQVLVNKEEYAFDMFEALNTTGEPLTAYETFKPKVIQAEKIDKYESSPSALALAPVEAYLDQFIKADARQRASSTLLIPFALLQGGEKLSKRLRDQRNWLRRFYEKASDLKEKREFVEGLSDVAKFLTSCWPGGKRLEVEQVAGLRTLGVSELGLVGLDLLGRANHNIVVSVLATFFGQVRRASDEEKGAAVEEFDAAIRAAVAMFVLWRGSKEGTARIDEVYRGLMKTGAPEKNVAPFAKGARDKAPTAEELRICLREQLENRHQVSGREDWVAKAEDLPIYSQSVLLTRFSLYCASHNTIPDPSRPGFVKLGKAGSCEMLTLESWHRDLEVEHIAPQSPAEGSSWNPELYTEELVDRLGNLSLLPRRENASAGNSEWAVKRSFFRVLGSTDLEHVDVELKAAAALGLQLPRPTEEILKSAAFLPTTTSLGEVALEPGWTPDLVRQRSRDTALRIWAVVSPWVGL